MRLLIGLHEKRRPLTGRTMGGGTSVGPEARAPAGQRARGKGRSRLKKAGKNVLALLMGCVVALAVLEGVLRIHNTFEFRVKGDKIVLPANKRYVQKIKGSKKLESKLIHTKNSLGFRGEEPGADFDRRLTILTVGGSTTECFYLSDGLAWPDVLAKRLKTAFDGIWLNNAGLDGHSTFGHIVLTEDYIVKLRPKLVLFLLGINDVGREGFRPQMMSHIRAGICFDSLEGFIKSMSARSEVFSMGLNMYRCGRAKTKGLPYKEIDVREEIEQMAMPDEKTIRRRKEEHKEKYLKGYEERLRTLVEIQRANEIEPVFVTQPVLRGDVVDDATGVNLAKTKAEWEVLELYNDVTRRVGREAGILVIDLAKAMPKSSTYYMDWSHYTAEGAEVVGQLVFERLRPHLEERYGEYVARRVDGERLAGVFSPESGPDGRRMKPYMD